MFCSSICEQLKLGLLSSTLHSINMNVIRSQLHCTFLHVHRRCQFPLLMGVLHPGIEKAPNQARSSPDRATRVLSDGWANFVPHSYEREMHTRTDEIK